MHAADARESWIPRAFGRVLGRSPTARERGVLERLFARERAGFAADAARAAQFLAVGESPRDASLDVLDHAALAATCLAILNLDEAITRE
jgi:hypothetical protein